MASNQVLYWGMQELLGQGIEWSNIYIVVDIWSIMYGVLGGPRPYVSSHGVVLKLKERQYMRPAVLKIRTESLTLYIWQLKWAKMKRSGWKLNQTYLSNQILGTNVKF